MKLPFLVSKCEDFARDKDADSYGVALLFLPWFISPNIYCSWFLGTASFARIAQRSAEPDEVIDQLKWMALIPGRSAISAPKLCVCWRASPHES